MLQSLIFYFFLSIVNLGICSILVLFITFELGREEKRIIEFLFGGVAHLQLVLQLLEVLVCL